MGENQEIKIQKEVEHGSRGRCGEMYRLWEL